MPGDEINHPGLLDIKNVKMLLFNEFFQCTGGFNL